MIECRFSSKSKYEFRERKLPPKAKRNIKNDENININQEKRTKKNVNIMSYRSSGIAINPGQYNHR